jgi:hypothetical protein
MNIIDLISIVGLLWFLPYYKVYVMKRHLVAGCQSLYFDLPSNELMISYA